MESVIAYFASLDAQGWGETIGIFVNTAMVVLFIVILSRIGLDPNKWGEDEIRKEERRRPHSDSSD